MTICYNYTVGLFYTQLAGIFSPRSGICTSCEVLDWLVVLNFSFAPKPLVQHVYMDEELFLLLLLLIRCILTDLSNWGLRWLFSI